MQISPDLMNTIMVVLEVILALTGGFLAALWISLVIWTFRDIRSRTRDIFAQLLATLLVLILNIPGLLLYLILRPPERLTEAYERALEEEALLQDIEERAVCPACKRQVEKDFILCPACHTPLKKRCHECGRVLQLRWTICPYCGTPQDGAGAETEQAEPAEEYPHQQTLFDEDEEEMETAAWPASGRSSSHTSSED